MARTREAIMRGRRLNWHRCFFLISPPQKEGCLMNQTGSTNGNSELIKLAVDCARTMRMSEQKANTIAGTASSLIEIEKDMTHEEAVILAAAHEEVLHRLEKMGEKVREMPKISESIVDGALNLVLSGTSAWVCETRGICLDKVVLAQAYWHHFPRSEE